MKKRKLYLDKELATEDSQAMPEGGDPWHTLECPTATCMCNLTIVWMYCTNWCPIEQE